MVPGSAATITNTEDFAKVELWVKVLVLSQYWAPENGVPQRRWSWLTSLLTQQGHEVLVVAPSPHYERSISVKYWWKNKLYRASSQHGTGQSGERIVRSGFLPAGPGISGKVLNQAAVALGQLWMAIKLPKVIEEFGADLVIGTVPAIPTAFVTYVFSRRLKIPYVIDLRDAWPDLLNEARNWNHSVGVKSHREKALELGPMQVLITSTRLLMNLVLRHAKAILVTSSFHGESLSTRRSLRNGRRSSRAITVRNVFPPETEYVRASTTQRETSELNVLYAGTLGRAQNLSNALYAAAECKRRGLSVRLLFVGAGAAKPQLRQLAQDLDVQVEFRSRMGADQLEQLYEWADTALVHLAAWPELRMTVPSKTYELMSAGIHISAVVRGETARLIEQTEAGHVVQPDNPSALADLWERLIKSPVLLDISEKASSWVRYEREVIAPTALRQVLEEIVASK